MDNLNSYERWQIEKYGNIVGSIETTADGDLFESGIEELNRMAEWTEMMADRQLHEYEYQHTNQ